MLDFHFSIVTEENFYSNSCERMKNLFSFSRLKFSSFSVRVCERISTGASLKLHRELLLICERRVGVNESYLR